jgi:hypothetical protein
MAAYFFSEAYLKANTPITQNVDYQDLTPFIEPAQQTLIESRIGKSLYERLLQAIENQDWNADELELIKLIRPAVAYYTAYMALPFLQTKIRNKGLVKGTDNFIQTVSRQDMMDLRSEFSQMSGFYMEKVNEWLCLYSSRYPQYSDPDPLNDKHYAQPYDFGGFMTYKGTGYGLSDIDLILKTISYKKY